MYYAYCRKIEQIKALNPRCKVFVVPLLPTKMYECNVKATLFNRLIYNRLIYNDLLQCGLNVVPVLGWGALVDSSCGLSAR